MSKNTKNKTINGMPTVALEDLTALVLLGFLENIDKLGCPDHKDVDDWFRTLPWEKQTKVAGKLIKIIQSYDKK